MEVIIANHRITYTVEGEQPIVLLAPQDICDSEPAKEGAVEVQTDPGLLANWVTHHARGNVRATLTWDRYVRCSCQHATLRESMELWAWLCSHPEGTLTWETAFQGLTSRPLITWRMHATLNRCTTTPLDVDTLPFDGVGYHATFDFNISDITTD